MPTPTPNPPKPADLKQAMRPDRGQADRDAHEFCRHLAKYGSRDDFHWGFIAYRTAYSPACTDDDFKRAMEIVEEYVRCSCLVDIKYDSDGNVVNHPDDKPEKQLSQRFRNDIVQDQTSLEGASITDIRRLAKDHIESRGAEISESSRYRFVLIFDEEAIKNLLKMPVPVVEYPNQSHGYSAKLLDIEFHRSQLDPDFFDGVNIYEGWCWTGPWQLMEAWFLCRDHDETELIKFDGEHRPVNRMVTM